ncbi:MAG: hypothetical protein AAFR46_12210 [Pseudomonadota bacterium]
MTPKAARKIAGLAGLGFAQARLELGLAHQALAAAEAALAAHRQHLAAAAAETDPAAAAVAARHRLWMLREEARRAALRDRARAAWLHMRGRAAKALSRQRAADALAERCTTEARQWAERRAEAAQIPRPAAQHAAQPSSQTVPGPARRDGANQR